MTQTARDYLCLAMDSVDRDTILRLADAVHEDIGCFKINAAFVRYGSTLVRELQQRRLKVFLDLKFHDIPATVAAHVRAAADLNVDWLTVHAAGGTVMMKAAAAARDEAAHQPRILAVSVLTSLDGKALNDELRVAGTVADHVAHLANMAVACRMDGMVCSANDLSVFRERLPEDFSIVTPGISGLTTAAGADQKRVMDPVNAIRAGATMLVIGRAVLNTSDPVAAARAIRTAIEPEL